MVSCTQAEESNRAGLSKRGACEFLHELRGNFRIQLRPILVLPPTDIQVIECEQSEAEHGLYDALYKKSLPGNGKKFSS
nr:putative SWI/SNF-related matrix-associated actin-dependent regulator of chromatin subfamily A member 3-like 3 [Ipomoea batatas]GMD79563.1 putative SWI/SNF-related matrix-associated actin-dependent regulator of chromatin subfamily A member 3-like 3 [Ipomoea batatas]